MTKIKCRLPLLVGLFLPFLIVGCSSRSASESITLVSTTSTRDSGLFDELIPKFEKQTGIRVRVVALGSGQAMEFARRGDADLLLTHAPAAEQEFVKEGFGIERRAVMYNDFVLVGPSDDSAGVRGMKSIAEVFSRLSEAEAPFVSRGDNSGTHMKEKAIWRLAGISPSGDWYLQAGSGMAHTLRVANERRAYALTDRGTFLAQREQLELEILCEGDSVLRNDYSVMLVNPQRHPHAKTSAARKFADFLTAPSTQQSISEFGVDKYGQPLFFPSAESTANFN